VNKFDLLISDIALPDGSGMDLMIQLRAISKIPGIAISGFGNDGDIERSLRAGFSQHLIKPIKLENLKLPLSVPSRGSAHLWRVDRMRVVDLKIEDVAFGGKGVGRDQRKAVFVPYTIEGEIVSAEIVREKKQFAEAELIEANERSPDRVEPQCPYFGRCGGCAYQHISYEHQLAIKWRQVRDALQRIGKLKDVPMRPIISSPKQYAYRNRITVHAQDGVIGFFRRDSHQLIDIEHCPISTDEVNRALIELRAQPYVRDGHYALRASISSRVFSQTNDEVANALRDLIVDLVPPNQELLIDAYCGSDFLQSAARQI
jgi:23S rRNA (uracil1939-C5)-methyltransferase